ncbi:P-loop containing nucleoside triphosphate hydrolase protein [Daldinia caldariorum]|uniref:P-loop containing nucleoside triphosphate hydrolase protein n=1 Tax=Daldinia caldariorum TaxID=326644 RepID=UPI00200884C5|nr:P-loop containing nucleoside triphosphate hydrolase protein [Daldinia caldariorum]KAI1470780.1 P-loop containing nucleoside triphosphate hydrolase protein [Daldinia caldariorum]
MSLLALTCRAPLGYSRLLISSSICSRHHGSTWFSIRRLSSHTATPRDASISYIRNIGIIAHVDAGKTTTTEQMLYNCGALRRAGNVDQGDTVTDFLPMERQRGITIQSAAITFNWPTKERLKPGGYQHIINLIDTPGHVDFRFELDRCVPILDGVICVIDGVEGVEAHTERVCASAHEFKVPRIVFVNKLDREGASFKKSVQDIGLKLNGMPLVCQIPWWQKDTLRGVVDVIDRSVVSWMGTKDSPEELSTKLLEGTIADEVERAREQLIERLCEHDDELMELWTTHGNDLPSNEIRKSIRRVVNRGDGSVMPVFAGSSLKNTGVTALLDAIVDYLPSPSDRPELQVRMGRTYQPLGHVIQPPKPSKKSPPRVEGLASVFKVVHDPRRGMLTFVRVYHGVLKKNTRMWNANLQQFESSLNMMQISGETTTEISHLAPGQIGAITGLKAARTGDTLLTFNSNSTPQTELGTIQVRPPEIPPAVAFIVLDAYSVTGAKILEAALENLSREDPSLRWFKDEKTEQYTLSGMGTLHLEVARDRLENHYKAEAYWGKISVDYKECLTAPTAPHHTVFEGVVAGKSGKAACSVEIEPLEGDHGDKLLGNHVERDGNIIQIVFPKESALPNIEEVRQHLTNGVIAALARGPRRGSPMHKCLVTVTYDVSINTSSTPSSHLVGAANKAVRTALKEAHQQGTIGILEPVMKVTIVCPEVSAGAVQHDIHTGRGGHVLEVRDMQESHAQEGDLINISDIYAPPDPYEFQTTLRETQKGRLRMLEIIARIPFVEMLDYDTQLRGKTQGRHTLTMALETFEKVTGQREKDL